MFNAIHHREVSALEKKVGHDKLSIPRLIGIVLFSTTSWELESTNGSMYELHVHAYIFGQECIQRWRNQAPSTDAATLRIQPVSGKGVFSTHVKQFSFKVIAPTWQVLYQFTI